MPKTLADVAKAMKDIDFAMLNSKAEDGSIGARPMSNNGDVDYDGDSWFFTTDDTRMVADIGRDPHVGLSFQGKSGMLGMRPFFVAVEGRADIVRDKATFEAHWTPDLERWFKDGVDTPGLVMIHVRAERLHYWDGEDEGEVAV
ncbi:general stress protein 26 [Sphingomonas jejuensis]|uniref:General stress protein 26 n=1 Tax=Sphingomonas jejuensis TaxID=904715 RepID=A0ABX0XQ28_9SPHN|nr:general stress protein 26 [Sphingomonas jejuensis]